MRRKCSDQQHHERDPTKNIKKEILAYPVLRTTELSSWIFVPLVHLGSLSPYAAVRLVESNMIVWTPSPLNVTRVHKVVNNIIRKHLDR